MIGDQLDLSLLVTLPAGAVRRRAPLFLRLPPGPYQSGSSSLLACSLGNATYNVVESCRFVNLLTLQLNLREDNFQTNQTWRLSVLGLPSPLCLEGTSPNWQQRVQLLVPFENDTTRVRAYSEIDSTRSLLRYQETSRLKLYFSDL